MVWFSLSPILFLICTYLRPSLILAKRRLELREVLLANTQRERNTLLNEQEFNASAMRHLRQQMTAVKEVYIDMQHMGEDLSAALGHVRAQRESLDNELADLQRANRLGE